jgi:hypothetical protein
MHRLANMAFFLPQTTSAEKILIRSISSEGVDLPDGAADWKPECPPRDMEGK